MSSCASYVSPTHDLTDDVSRSQSRSNFTIAISPWIVQLERRSILKISDMLMPILLVYSTSGIPSGKKVCCNLKMAYIFKIMKYYTQLQFELRYEKIAPNCAKNCFHGDDLIVDVTGWPQTRPSKFLYTWINNIFKAINMIFPSMRACEATCTSPLKQKI